MKVTEAQHKAKTQVENLIREIWPDYNLSEAEYKYHLKRAKADKRRAGKFQKLYTEDILREIYLLTYTYYKSEQEAVKLTFTLHTATKLTLNQLTAGFLFCDAALNWSPQEFKEKVLSIN